MEESNVKGKRNLLVAMQIDNHNIELLSWALVNAAEPGDCVVAIHVCRLSAHATKDKPLLDSYLQVYDDLCSAIRVKLIGKISMGFSVRRTLVREAKNYDAVAIVIGAPNHKSLSWASIAQYCTRRLPVTTDLLSIHKGRIVFQRHHNATLPGLIIPGRTLNPIKVSIPRDFSSKIDNVEKCGKRLSSIMALTRNHSGCLKDDVSSNVCKQKQRSNSFFSGDILDHRPGWPLLRRASSSALLDLHARRSSVVQWTMSLPNRSLQQKSQDFSTNDLPANKHEDVSASTKCLSKLGKRGDMVEVVPKTWPSGCKVFCYEVLRTATSKFSPEALIGKGGSGLVYKGVLPDGKAIAVKIRKASEEARKDFAREIDIISSLNHKHVTPLLGVCINDEHLISVCDFFSRGSLEENLHGKNKDKSRLSWEVRFNIACRIAEALSHLHNKSSQPVIHRDVKSSNILLSNEFEPQLSDFGLAIWGPTTSTFVVHDDIVGTFGYLAPEYFMNGKLSNKVDIYAFGVVLLELLSGRKPIGFENHKSCQTSLVMWAKSMIKNGNMESIIDPCLVGNFDEVQLQRMVLAATLCITQAARLRPNMNKILELLQGREPCENAPTNTKNSASAASDNSEESDDDEVCAASRSQLHIDLAMLDVSDESTSCSSAEREVNLSLEDYLKERWILSSSSFD